MAQQHTPNSTTLQLNRHLQNHAFESWKIGSSFVLSRTAVDLTNDVFQGAADAVDFVHTRAALLTNHLFSSQGRLFTLTAAAGAEGSGISVNEVVLRSDGQQVSPVVQHVAGGDCAD